MPIDRPAAGGEDWGGGGGGQEGGAGTVARARALLAAISRDRGKVWGII